MSYVFDPYYACEHNFELGLVKIHSKMLFAESRILIEANWGDPYPNYWFCPNGGFWYKIIKKKAPTDALGLFGRLFEKEVREGWNTIRE